MTREFYTPGHDRNAESFMARRSLESHGSFSIPYLQRGLSVLDCGCGPGTMTSGIAAHVEPGKVIGVDVAQSQIDRATAQVTEAGLSNAAFHNGRSGLPDPHPKSRTWPPGSKASYKGALCRRSIVSHRGKTPYDLSSENPAPPTPPYDDRSIRQGSQILACYREAAFTRQW